MKKKILFVALLIISILTIDNIYAATPSTSFYATVRSVGRDGADTNCTYTANTGHYSTNIFKIKASNVEYDAFCIDPGKGIPGGNLTCEMMDSSSYPMIYASLLNQSLMGEGQLVKDIVFRTLGIMERQSLVFTETGSTGEFNTNKNNVILTLLWARKVSEHGIAVPGPQNFDYPKGGVWDTAGGYIGNAIQYWTGNYTGDRTPPPTNTENLAGIKETSGLIGNYFKLEKLSTDPANPRYRVTTLSGGQAAEVVISGVDGTVVNVEQPWNGTSAIFSYKVPRSKECLGKAMISGVIPGVATMGDVPYLCSASGNTQSYVALMPGNATDKFTNLPVEDCNSCDEHDHKEEKESGTTSTNSVDGSHLETIDVSLCCLDSTHSFMEEYKIDDLYEATTNTYIDVNYYTNKCGNDDFYDKELNDKLKEYTGNMETTTEKVENYCRVLCVENMAVDVPGSISSATGKYFKLTEVEGGGKGPKIKGTKACRIRIDYRTLRAHYEQAINGKVTDGKNRGISNANDGEVYWFNKYQDEQAWADLLNNPQAEHRTHTAHPTKMTFTRDVCTKSKTYTAAPGKSVNVYSYNSDGKCSSYTEKACASTETKNCEFSGYENEQESKESTPRACTTTYDTYEIKPKSYLGASSSGSGASQEYTVKYYDIYSRVDFPYGSNSFSGVDIKTNTTTHTHTYRRYSKYNLNVSDCTAAVNATVANYPSSKGWSHTGGSIDGDQYETTHKDYKTQNPASKWSTHSSSASTAKTNFGNKKRMANDLEKIIKGCETFFDSQPEGYDLNITANFHYMQVYLDANRNNAQQEYTVPFGTVKCGSGCDCPKVVNNQATSGIFKQVTEQMKDVKELPEQIIKAAQDMNDTAAPFEKNVREDIVYTATCQFPDPAEDGQMTLYPGPQYQSGTSISGELLNKATGHKYQYALFLTTYSTDYQTWWDISGLGTKRTKDKFMHEFNNHDTCATSGEGKALSTGGAENLKKGVSKVPFTCTLQVRDGGMRIGSCCTNLTSDLNGCCKTFNNNEVFEFRVVDPKNMFPGGMFKASNIAKNWKKDDGTYETARTYKKIHDDAVADKTYSKENMTYSFRIDTNAIRLIKQYNDTHDYDSFDNNKTCTCNSGPEDDSCGTITPGGSCQSGDTWTYSCSKCKSDFLTSLSDSIGVIPGVGNTSKKIWNSVKFTSIASLRNDDKSNEYTAGVHWA